MISTNIKHFESASYEKGSYIPSHNDILVIKEKLDLPPVMIELSNHYWTDSQSIGKEYELLLALFVQVDDSTDLVRVLLHRQLTGM